MPVSFWWLGDALMSCPMKILHNLTCISPSPFEGGGSGWGWRLRSDYNYNDH